MWVGGSEKNITSLFDRYRALVKESEIAPILFFNEADAIIGIRQQGAERAVDKMENSIQNIILQEMETIEGIMVATTNLTQNLDKAFERRFLYKIEFTKPSAEAKQQIWQTMIPLLPENWARDLSVNYEFSGGQIENIARKETVERIIHGGELSLDTLKTYCDEELLDKKPSRRRIGY
ncbi:MAG: ATP-binding protein [Mucinivorans sp.]